MSELRKAKTNLPYFVTSTVVGWIDVFTRSRYADVLIDSLRYCQQSKNLDVFAYVIMPSHIHLVVRNLDNKLSGIIRDFKSFTAGRIIQMVKNTKGESRKEWLLHMFQYHARFKNQNKKYQFWQKTSYPIELFTPKMIDQKINYIHMNPVAAGLVNQPEYWAYSSASSIEKLKILRA